MTPREKLAQLQRESKPSKFGNRPVYACKSCWKDTGRTKKWLSDMFVKIKHSCSMCPLCQACNNGIYSFDDIEIFDSKTEHTRGYSELKPLKTAEVITDLEHHDKFFLMNVFFNISKLRVYCYTHRYIPDDIQLLSLSFESDFTYMMKGEKVVEEAKELTRIDKTTSKTTAAGQKINQTVKVDFPYFTSDEDFRHFRKICQLMLAIYGHRVQVRAGGQLWMFNAKGELERIYGRIK